jgi:hypothetical protein
VARSLVRPARLLEGDKVEGNYCTAGRAGGTRADGAFNAGYDDGEKTARRMCYQIVPKVVLVRAESVNTGVFGTGKSELQPALRSDANPLLGAR